ncbi:MAG: AMP-binding protein [Chloroflexota bacterium]
MFGHLYELVVERARRYPDAIALGSQQGLAWRTLNSRELLAATDALARELADRGVLEGDRVVLWMPSDWRTPVYHFALWKLGAIVVPFDREMNPEAAARIIDLVEPRLIVAGVSERPAWARTDLVVEWWEPATTGSEVAASPWSRPSQDLAAIVFTSGTTGNPKGCMITHGNLCSQVNVLSDNIPVDPSCRLASILPLSHLFELTGGLLYPLSRGAAIHYVPSRRGPDILRVFNEQRITHMIAVPQLFTLMGQTLETQLRAKLSPRVFEGMMALADRLPLRARRALFFAVHRKLGGHLVMVASGGAALPPETQRLWERLGVRVVQGYGASECSPVVACGAPDGSTPLGSVGRPIRDVQVRLSADGELQVYGPNVMRGYWKDPERTAEALHDGWYSTGDLATIDPQGNIRLAGRAKELIVLPSGMNVWPGDVEDVLRHHPHVSDAAVILVPGAGGGATLHAYLLPTAPASRDLDVRTIVAESNGRLALHQRVATASWWPDPDFPRTNTLKVRRHLLPAPEAVHAAAVVDATLAADDPIGQAIAAVARSGAPGPQQTLAELGLDSLMLVELALALEEKTGRAVSDADLRPDMTVAEVREVMSQAPPLGSDEAVAGPDGGGVPVEQPLWPYTWGRVFRWIGFPFDVLFRLAARRISVIGAEHLANLPQRVILAGTHHSFADHPLVRYGLAHSPAHGLDSRLVVAAWAGGVARAGVLANYARIAWGIYALHQDRQRDASLRGLARLAERGSAIMIFPQGQHVEPELEAANDPAARFKPGVSVLAQALDAAVVPFGTAGTEDLIPPTVDHHKGIVIGGVPLAITRAPLAIAFGEPMRMEQSESAGAFAARLQEACFALARQAEAALRNGHERT